MHFYSSGINVGGKNKVVMADLKKDLAGLGLKPSFLHQ